MQLKKPLMLLLSLFVLAACTSKQAKIDYSEQYAKTDDQNRAVQTTSEAMPTDDLLATLSEMLGAPDQYDVTPNNVYFIRDVSELGAPAYARYDLRVADNMPYQFMGKGKGPQSLQSKVEEVMVQYPTSFIAVNKSARLVAIAGTKLEAQALAQREPAVFYVLRGESLQETIERWSKQSSWHMEWAIDKDYDIVAPAVVFGEFNKPGGSLDQLLESFRYRDSPMKAQFARNRVVVIRENTFNSDIMGVMP